MSPDRLLEIASVAELVRRRAEWEAEGRRVGLVPTMGFLHEGHLELMRRLRQRCDTLLVSIFVNPSQFGHGEDLAAYPRDPVRDAELCASVGVDALFLPAPEEVYPPGFDTWIHPGMAGERACGPWRPGHFRGVLTVVYRLFHWVRPQVSIFGRKDAQQLWLIRRMARDMGLEHRIEEGPLVRDPDGLAMSSRNIYLQPEEREAALALPRTLQALAREIAAGGNPQQLLAEAWQRLRSEKLLQPQYLELVDWQDFRQLQEGETLPQDLVLLGAVKAGKARLIDNVFLRKGREVEI